MSSPSSPGSAASRWVRRKEARPAEIQEAALKVFAEKGYAGARMDDIARAAGVTKGTIYLYFDSKEAVFKSLVRGSIGAALTQMDETQKSFHGPAKTLLRFALGTIAHMLASGGRDALPKIILSESANFPELARFWRREIIDRGIARMSAIVELGIAQGEFRKLPVEHVVRLCMAPLLLSVLWRSTFAQFDAVPYDYQGLLDTHLDVLFQGLAP
ncbi:MAG: TetR/AcrR family transcriptional regulator [Alphaproteobacteria bacterium]|nr:TetR/AcrR family transcriptional regulator [Alphaproteobacteria bacterium]MBV9692944.1 TetR/AcrR family transcriptional regulator [Alphaproteobacteria bacterium]